MNYFICIWDNLTSKLSSPFWVNWGYDRLKLGILLVDTIFVNLLISFMFQEYFSNPFNCLIVSSNFDSD